MRRRCARLKFEMRSAAEDPISPALKSGETLKGALLVAQGIILLVLAGLAQNVVASVRHLEGVTELPLRIEQLRGTIVHLDEVLLADDDRVLTHLFGAQLRQVFHADPLTCRKCAHASNLCSFQSV